MLDRPVRPHVRTPEERHMAIPGLPGWFLEATWHALIRVV